jgi:alkyl hydroperoxide reductase subunit F
MLSKEILTAVQSYTATMNKPVTLVLQMGQHDKREELKQFLAEIVGVAEHLHLVERDEPRLRSAISFGLEVEGEFNGVFFSGIPSGHEFNSFILAVLQSSGTELKLDKGIQSIVKGVSQPCHFEVFVSLSCHNCPDVVQSLNQFALLNPLISSEMIDGGLYPELIKERNIQGVPSVYLNGKIFANGQIDTGKLIEKLRQVSPSSKIANKVTNIADMLPLQDVTVIGGGPAGVSAAIYSARKGLKVSLIADKIGGQVKDTVGIENLISVVQTTGTELTGDLHAHLEHYDINVKQYLQVEKIGSGDHKQIHLSTGEIINSKTVIIATGAKWRELGVPGEKENIGQGVAYCPHCDGPFFKGKDVAVVGGGNSGIEAALDLAGMVNHVTVFEFMPELKADQVLVDKAQANSKITIINNAASQEIVSKNGKVVALKYQDRSTGEIHEQSLSGIFVQIGLVPNSGFVKGLVEQTAHGEIIIDQQGRTSEPGIFACGDVTTVPYKQIVIAIGEGAKASLSAFDHMMRAS